MVALPASLSLSTRPMPFPTPLHNPTHFFTPFPTPSICQHSPRTLSHTSPHLPHTLSHIYPYRKSREDGDASPPRNRQHPPNTCNVQVVYRYSKLSISERDDLFFGLHFILGKKLGICNLLFFWSSLHFGQQIGHLRTCQFCSIIPPMLNIDLHPRPYTPSTFSLLALLTPSTMPRSPTTRPSTLASCRFNC